MKVKIKKTLHLCLKGAVIIKAFDGIIDIVASIILMVMGRHALTTIIPYLVRKELIHDPHDFIANYLLHLSYTFLASTHTFVVMYLIVHGIIKIGLGMTLMSKNHRVHFTAGVVLAFFVVYEIFRYSHTGSLILLGATVFDLLTLFLIYHEFKKTVRSSIIPH